MQFVTQEHPSKTLYEKPDELITNPDAIIIGSGLGGLSLASILAQRREMKVLVLEAAPVPGGCTHVHEFDGFEFNSGLHSVGDMDTALNPGALHRHVADYVTGERVQWARMPDLHEYSTLGDERFGWYSTPEQNIEMLSKRFPDEADKIRRYYDLEAKVAARGWSWGAAKILPGWIPDSVREAFFKTTGGVWRSYMNRQVGAVLRDELSMSEQLAAALSYMYGNYGRTPKHASFTLHASMMSHYRYGAYYPVGGPAQLAHTIVPIIVAAGGQVAVSTPVASILVDRNQAVGVKLEDGREVRAPIVISDGSVYETFMRLLPREVASKHGYTQIFDELSVSPAHAYLFLGYDEHIDLPQHIVWQMPRYDDVSPFDLDGGDVLYKREMRMRGAPAYVLSPSARDPVYQQRYANKSTVIVLAEAGEGWVERSRRDPIFRAEFEAKVKEGLHETAVRQFPALAGKTPKVMRMGTPVGCNVRAKDGCSYGLEAAAARFTTFTHKLRPRTKIEGLFLTGQDTFFPGIAGVMLSARFTYAAITGDLMHVASTERSPLAGAQPPLLLPAADAKDRAA